MAALAVLLLLSIGRGLSWGLPSLPEEATPLRKAIEFWGASTGGFSFNPHFYNYPSLSFYLHFLVQAVLFPAGMVAGTWSSLNEFRDALASDLPRFIMAARWTTAAIAAATVFPVWLIGRRLGGTTGGLVAALLIAVSPVFTAQARLIGTDAPLAFATAMGLLFILDVPGGGPNAIRRAALCVGLAASCKYPGAVLAVPLAAAMIAGRRPRRDYGIAFLQAFLAFAATSPFVILDLPDAIQALRFERHHMATGHFGGSAGPAVIHYATDVLPRALTWPGIAAAAAALGFFLVRGGAVERITALFGLTALVLIGSWRVAADRYVLLVLPALAALIGGLFGRAKTVQALGLALILAVPMAAQSIKEGAWRALPTTQSAATEWALKHIPRKTLTAVERYSVEAVADSFATFIIPFDAVQPHVYDIAYSLPYYAPFEYVVLSGAQYNRYLSRPEEFPAQAMFYDGVARDFDLVAAFEPGSGLTGSEIRVFRRKPGTGARDFRSISGDVYNRVTNRATISRFLTSLGAAFSKGDREDLAQAAVEQAITLSPGDPRALSNLASIHARRGEYLPALKGYQRALEIAPDDPILHYNIGVLYQGKSLWSEALAAYARALRLNPRFAEAYLASAICHVELGQSGAARVRLEEFLREVPGNPRAPEARAMLRELASLR